MGIKLINETKQFISKINGTLGIRGRELSNKIVKGKKKKTCIKFKPHLLTQILRESNIYRSIYYIHYKSREAKTWIEKKIYQRNIEKRIEMVFRQMRSKKLRWSK